MARHDSNHKLESIFNSSRLKAVIFATAIPAAVVIAGKSADWTLAILKTRAMAMIGAIFLSTVVAAQTSGGGASARPATLNAELVNKGETFARTMLAGDAHALAAMFTDDGVAMPPNQPSIKGRPAIEAWYEAFFKGPVKMTAFTLSHTEARVEGGVGYHVGTYQQRLQLPDGQTVTDTGKFVVIAHRVGGDWKVAYSTYNSDLPTPPCAKK